MLCDKNSPKNTLEKETIDLTESKSKQSTIFPERAQTTRSTLDRSTNQENFASIGHFAKSMSKHVADTYKVTAHTH